MQTITVIFSKELREYYREKRWHTKNTIKFNIISKTYRQKTERIKEPTLNAVYISTVWSGYI